MRKMDGYFNSQPHEEADMASERNGGYKEYFNSQPHEEADAPLAAVGTAAIYFNSQPHEEADERRKLRKMVAKTFQFTASRRG